MPKLILKAQHSRDTTTSELLDLLAPPAERRAEAQRLLEFALSGDLIRQELELFNPARPAAVAGQARAVAELARLLTAAVEALRRDLRALRCSPVGMVYGLGSLPQVVLELDGALASAEQDSVTIAERLEALPSLGAPRTRDVRHRVVMNLASVFTRLHVSRYSPEHLFWRAERNRFLRAALAAAGFTCDLRAIERHLAKIESDSASIVTGAVT